MFDLREESARLAAEAAIDWAALEGSRVMITGVTGLVGSHCARFLMERNPRSRSAKLRIACKKAACRNAPRRFRWADGPWAARQ